MSYETGYPRPPTWPPGATIFIDDKAEAEFFRRMAEDEEEEAAPPPEDEED